MNLDPIDYSGATPPASYKCDECGKHGCKLWRLYNVFLDHQELTCCDCAGEKTKCDVSSIDADGRRLLGNEYGMDWGDQRTDQIGSRIPAVPTEEGDTYWGYTSVPQAGVEWWRRLPTRT